MVGLGLSGFEIPKGSRQNFAPDPDPGYGGGYQWAWRLQSNGESINATLWRGVDADDVFFIGM